MRKHLATSRRPRWTQPEREELVAKYQASGLAQREFSQQHGIKLGTFRQWMYRPRSVRPVARPKKPTFQEVSITEVPFLNGWAAELQLPGGVALRLNSQARAEWVAALVEKLGAVC